MVDSAVSKLSVVMPARNEGECITNTVLALVDQLSRENIQYEIVVINDHSTDNTREVVEKLSQNNECVRCIDNEYPGGFGFAVRMGLDKFRGDYVAVVMADHSDDPRDLVVMFDRAIKGGYDCVFGNRFCKAARVVGYPLHKLVVNRLANKLIQSLFFLGYKDVTNAFKLYSRSTIHGLKPFLSNHFNITVELPLKAIIRNYSYTVVPTNWTNRKTGISKLRIKEMGSRYLFIVLYCLLERWLSKNDYVKDNGY